MFDKLFINGLIILFPYLVYIFYITTNRRLNIKEKNIFQFLINITSVLFLVKYGVDKNYVIILLNIPLFFSLMNRKYFTYGLVVLTIIWLYNVNIFYITVLFFNYLLLIALNKIVKNANAYIFTFIIINSIMYFLILNHISSLAPIACFIILLTIFNIMYKMGNDIIGFNQELNELEKDKEVKKSLFKITHEIKNPIAVLKAYLDMYDVKDEKKSKKYLKIMKSEVDRVLCLLEDFMLVNKDSINCDIMDINLLLEEKVKNINDLMNVRHINIKYELNDDEIYVMGDYNRLSQVFINLIKNSIEANSNNIILKCYTKDDKVIVDIKDDGMGIEDQIISKIKEPFYTTKLKGTGLGVSLSDEIIEAHNGTLTYKSEYGKGTSVKVVLPLYEIV
ncbi:MAG: HAMP domain-containing histidine kinase [Bacilli bacterium]|nr:HAMP domain-containing histidine kinase [Bacilli bacterium]